MSRIYSEEKSQLDVLLSCVRTPRRRYLLQAFSNATLPVPMEGLVEQVAELELNAQTTQISKSTLQKLSVSIYHVHLPKLEEADVIDIDENSHTIYEGDNFEAAVSLLNELSSWR